MPFGEVRDRRGGGTAGHRGIRSVKEGLGSSEFWRVRVGVGRPDSTDPEVVSQHVLSRFTEPPAGVRALIERAADTTERLLEREYAAGEKPA
jgi:peptidyl-tRNA hydrolase, PTH1 family